MLETLSLANISVEGAFRLNAKDKEKPKPLVIVLKDKETRNKLLQAVKKLKGTDESYIKEKQRKKTRYIKIKTWKKIEHH